MSTTDLVNRYFAIWNEPDSDARLKMVSELWVEDGTYVDPLADVRGHEAIAAVITGARDTFPGTTIALTAGPDPHHNVARFSWAMGPEGGESVVEGSDLVVTDGASRIIGVYGFLDKVPPTD
jgi:hypothetical protein